MSHEVLQRQFRGRRKEVEVDECFLTRRKYHKGWQLRSGTATMFSIYERDTNLGFHIQVKAVLIWS